MSSSPTVIQGADVRAPVGSFPSGADRLSGTTGEDHNTTKLRGGEMATIIVGAQAIRATWSGTLGGSTQVASTDLLLAANSRFDWVVTEDVDDVIYIEASDATTAYEAWVWSSSGAR